MIGSVELGQHLNGDESMTFGSAFYAASLSKYFRVKPVTFHDGFNFPIQMKLSPLDENDQVTLGNEEEWSNLFNVKESFGSTKSLNLKENTNSKIEFKSGDEKIGEL